MTDTPTAIEEYCDTGQPIALDGLVGSDRPLMIRGLCRIGRW